MFGGDLSSSAGADRDQHISPSSDQIEPQPANRDTDAADQGWRQPTVPTARQTQVSLVALRGAGIANQPQPQTAAAPNVDPRHAHLAMDGKARQTIAANAAKAGFPSSRQVLHIDIPAEVIAGIGRSAQPTASQQRRVTCGKRDARDGTQLDPPAAAAVV